MSRLILPPIDNEVFTFDVAGALQLFFQENCCIWIAPDRRIFDLPNDNERKALLRSGCCAEACRMAGASIAATNKKSRRFIKCPYRDLR